MSPCLTPTSEGVIVAVYVQPRASKNEIVGMQGDELKIRLTSPPVEGAANRLCGRFLAGLLGVAKGQVELVAGAKSRHKRFLIRGVAAAGVRQQLAPEDVHTESP